MIRYCHVTHSVGFSLVEMLVAISILLLVLVGPMSVTSQVARSASFASEQVQATFLAQEGIEMVQKMRDELFLQYFDGAINNPWARFRDTSTSGILQQCHASAGCGLEWQDDTTLRTPIACSTATACLLYVNNGSVRSRYTHQSTGNTPTKFTRIIKLAYDGANPNMVKVTSTVTWRTGSLIAQQRVETTTYLYNTYATP